MRISASPIYLVYVYGILKKYRTLSLLITVKELFFSSKAIVLSFSSTLILAKQRSASKKLLTTLRKDKLDFLFAPSVPFSLSP